MILWILLILILFIFMLSKKKKEGMTTIPANLFQTWKTKNLPPFMKACVSRLKRQNPEFKYFLYDDEDCREFIAEHFDTDVLESFDILLPGAYKADLWRYCVLYMRGGIYLDIKYECVKDFKLESLLGKAHYVIDRKEFAEPGKNVVYNGFIVSPAKNPILKKCIDQIVRNVKNREYGFNPLYPTGPGLFGEILGRDKDIDLEYSTDAKNILWNGKKILQMYPEYREEQDNLQPGKHYDNLWKQGIIYQP